MLIHEDIPQYDIWLRLILGSVLAFTLVLGIFLIPVDRLGAWIAFGATAFDALLFHAVLPRRYQIFTDRVRIVLGWPFTFSIALTSITEARAAAGFKAFAYGGIRWATSSRTVVELVRNRGLNVVISPSKRELFLERLNEARRAG